MSTALQTRTDFEGLEQVLIGGDLAKLNPDQRVTYYRKVCDSVGLNPFTKPFEYITLNSKLTLYARKDATDQMRKINGVSIIIVARERHDDVYVVTARATDRSGRTDEAIGAVNIAGLKGDTLCNALMKAETKAKRRVTLSICGLGWLDETEIETIPSAQTVAVAENGQIIDATPDPTPEPPAEDPEAAKLDKVKDAVIKIRRKHAKLCSIAEPSNADLDGLNLFSLTKEGERIKALYIQALTNKILDAYSLCQELDFTIQIPDLKDQSVSQLEQKLGVARAHLATLSEG